MEGWDRLALEGWEEELALDLGVEELEDSVDLGTSVGWLG